MAEDPSADLVALINDTIFQNATLVHEIEAILCVPAREKEGGIFNGVGPLTNEILILIVQIVFIRFVVRLLGYPLKLLHQPKVISEILAGIVLGPTVLGHIPNFSETLFTPDSMSNLQLFSQFGLILYLFTMGLELDLVMLRENMKKATVIATVGMAAPFIAFLPVGYLMYTQFIHLSDTGLQHYDYLPKNDSLLHHAETGQVHLFPFLLFCGVAACLTAFPVLARILAEHNLLSSTLGITVICAAAVNDTLAWVLLALVIAVAKASHFVNIIYVMAVLTAYCCLMYFGVKLALEKLVPMLDEKQVIELGLMVCFASAWFTSFLGVHSIFGAFMAGLCFPRVNFLNDHMIEKIEELIQILFLPMYFAYSGLRTNLFLLNQGVAWAIVLLCVFTTCVSKIGSTIGATWFLGIEGWKDRVLCGIFMNCKGLVDLIILNVGLDLGVLNRTVFTIMVLNAISCALITSPTATYVMKKLDRAEEKGTEEYFVELDESQPLIGAEGKKHVYLDD